MPMELKTRTRSGYIIAFLLLLISYFLIFYTIQRLVKGTRAITRSHEIIYKLESTQTMVSEAETSVRGFVITGQENFLEPYQKALKDVPVHSSELRKMQPASSTYYASLDTLDRLIHRKMKILETGIRGIRDSGFITTTMLAQRNEGKNVMDSIRNLIHRLQKEEEVNMARKNATLSGAFNTTDIIAVSSLVIAIITIIYSLLTYNRENRAREKANEKARSYRLALENKITELGQVNEELRALKQIEKFAATGRIARTIAHEVRNPLTNITLAAEQLSELVGDKEEPSLLLEMINRNSLRINQLVTDLLQSTRFAQLNFEVVDINQLVEDTLSMAADRIGLNNITVRKHYSQEKCEVRVDREKMHLALLNIIVNAIEAMEKDKGVLTVSTSRDKNKCIVEITDNGHGMDEEAVLKVFDPYYTSKRTGTGLGLTNTQNIIYNHKGTLFVKSRIMEGTSFFVTLNIA